MRYMIIIITFSRFYVNAGHIYSGNKNFRKHATKTLIKPLCLPIVMCLENNAGFVG